MAGFEHFQFKELLLSAKYEKRFSKNQITVSFVSLFFFNHIIKQSEIELELQALSYLLMSSYSDRAVLQKTLFATVHKNI